MKEETSNAPRGNLGIIQGFSVLLRTAVWSYRCSHKWRCSNRRWTEDC